MREKAIEAKLVKAVRIMGGLAPKFVSPGFDGVPDRLVLLPKGKIAFMEEVFAVTELTKGLPLYRRMARSMVSGSAVSICKGRGETPWSSWTTSHIKAGSSISGRPTFTSSTWAPASC